MRNSVAALHESVAHLPDGHPEKAAALASIAGVLRGAGRLAVGGVGGVLQALDAAAVRRAFFGTPLMTLGVVARIHWHALRLWAKRVPFHGKPSAPKRFVTR